MPYAIHTNIYKLYLIKLSKWFMLIMPVVALYYTENGLDNFDIYLLQAIYSFSVAAMEIPSGYMADVIGRKKSIIIGSVLGTLGFVIYSVASGFNHFLAAEIILGLGGSFISGSDSALLYDSLATMQHQHRYLQYEGRITSLGNFAETTAAICGGVIAALLSYRAVYISQALVAAIAIPAALLLVEPERARPLTSPRFGQIIDICRHALVVNKKLRATILLSAVTGTATLCMAWTCQIYFVSKGLDEITITPIWVALNLTVAIVSAMAHKVRHLLGGTTSLLLIIVYIPLGYILLGALPLIPALCGLLFFYAIRGYATPVLKDLTNQNCDSHIRATVLSLRSLIIRTSFSLLGPFIGIISRKQDLPFALVLTGCVFLLLSVGAGFFLFRHVPEAVNQPES